MNKSKIFDKARFKHYDKGVQKQPKKNSTEQHQIVKERLKVEKIRSK